MFKAYSSGDSGKGISAAGMSPETAHKEVKKYDAHTDHRQSLTNAILSYDFYLEYVKHCQEAHLEKFLPLAEIRNVCTAFLNSWRPIKGQRKEIQKGLNRFPKVYESCIFTRFKRAFDTFTKREEDQDPDHG